MSPETVSPDGWDAAGDALREVERVGGASATGEVLLRRARGSSARIARASATELATWEEEAVAVLAVLPGGRRALVTAASWSEAVAAAGEAVARADAQAHAPAAAHRARARPVPSRPVPRVPPTPGELVEALSAIEATALGVDPRVVALDAASLRAAVVDSYLCGSSSLACHQRQLASSCHATAIARDGVRVALRGEAWAGPSMDDAEVARFGARVGTSALVHLAGSGAAPPVARRILLRPGALAELTFALAPALMGLRPARPPGRGPFDARLSLVEDSHEDASRALAVDGAGRPLRRVPILEGGAWRRPRFTELPWVRGALADVARPGWMRLTWRWEGGEGEDDLLRRLDRGLVVESLHASAVDGAVLQWRGSASGWWAEDGRLRHPVAGVPLSLGFEELARGARGGGIEPGSAHASGTVRAMSLLIEREEPG